MQRTKTESVGQVLKDILSLQQAYISKTTVENAEDDLQTLRSRYQVQTNTDPVIDTIRQFFKLARDENWGEIQKATKDGRSTLAIDELSALQEVFEPGGSPQIATSSTYQIGFERYQQTNVTESAGEPSQHHGSQSDQPGVLQNAQPSDGDTFTSTANVCIQSKNQQKLLDISNTSSNIKKIEVFLEHLRRSSNAPQQAGCTRPDVRNIWEEIKKGTGVPFTNIDLVLYNSNHWEQVFDTTRKRQINDAMRELDMIKKQLLLRGPGHTTTQKVDVANQQHRNQESGVAKHVPTGVPGMMQQTPSGLLKNNERSPRHKDKFQERNKGSDEASRQMSNTASSTENDVSLTKAYRCNGNPAVLNSSDLRHNQQQMYKSTDTNDDLGLTETNTQNKSPLVKDSSSKGKDVPPEEVIKRQEQQIRDLSTRLSQMAGDKLRMGNPNITDLSDANRPTKLAERFSELYDNEWSDAYEEMVAVYKHEETVIQVLLKVVARAGQYCHSLKECQLRVLQEVMVRPDHLPECTVNLAIGVETQRELENKTLLDTVEYGVRQAQKTSSAASIPVLKLMFRDAMKTEIFPQKDDHESKYFELYAMKCVEIIWLMLAQDPPMDLVDCTIGAEAPPYYKEYTERGNAVGAVVWPALFLHVGGPLMNKGVAIMKITP